MGQDFSTGQWLKPLCPAGRCCKVEPHATNLVPKPTVTKVHWHKPNRIRFLISNDHCHQGCQQLLSENINSLPTTSPEARIHRECLVCKRGLNSNENSSVESCGLTVRYNILDVNQETAGNSILEENLSINHQESFDFRLMGELSPLHLSPEDGSFPSYSPIIHLPSDNVSSDDHNMSTSVVEVGQDVKPNRSLKEKRFSSCRSKSPSPSPSVRKKSIDLNRSNSFSTFQQDHRGFREADLLIGEVLGQGFFGLAFKVTYIVTGEQMVLKELHNFDEGAQKSFLREVAMLRNLSHPCVLKFLGVLYRNKKLNLVTEFIDGGTLSDLLLNQSIDLSWKQRIGFAKDIADGMNYLHSMNIIHRDLNSQNCFVRKNQTVVVADFGLAKTFPGQEAADWFYLMTKAKDEDSKAEDSSTGTRRRKKHSRQQRGTIVGNPYWMAPEMMMNGVYDEKVDVFSYGIIVCETIARVSADPDYLPRSFDFGLNVEAFHRRFCENTLEPYFMLAVLCSHIEPDQRPSFEKIHILCEALLLHVEHGVIVPAELQGSTVNFYHNMKKKLYGLDYKDVDSCAQAKTNKIREVTPDNIQDTYQCEISGDENLHEVDNSDQVLNISSVRDEGGHRSCCRTDNETSNTYKHSRALPASNSSPDFSKMLNSNNRITHGDDMHIESSELKEAENYKINETCSSSTEFSSAKSNIGKTRPETDDNSAAFEACAYSSPLPSDSSSNLHSLSENLTSCKIPLKSLRKKTSNECQKTQATNKYAGMDSDCQNPSNDNTEYRISETKVAKQSHTSDQISFISDLSFSASEQTGTSYSNRRALSHSFSTEFSSDIRRKSPPRLTSTDYKRASQIEYETHVFSLPPSSYTPVHSTVCSS